MSFLAEEPIPRKDKLSVSFIVENLRNSLKLQIQELTEGDLSNTRFVTEIELHRPGMALTGYVDLFTYQRIQILGNTETQYLERLSGQSKIDAIANLTKFEIPAVFLTDGNTLPPELIQKLQEAGIPVYTSALETTRFMFLLRDFLEDQFALQTMAHGTMVDVYGIGLLVVGKSGIGKSEVTLDLIERGHRLVADDVVLLRKKNNLIISSTTELSKHFMEVRGLGIVDVMSMFGIRSVRYQKRLEVVLELTLWNESYDVERTGLGNSTINILGLELPLIKLPMTPGKNITVIAEVIAMNYLLKHYGYDPAKAFQKRVKEKIAHKAMNKTRGNDETDELFESDLE